MMREYLRDCVLLPGYGLVRFTGLFVFLGIMALAAACNGEPVLYSVEEPETYEEPGKNEEIPLFFFAEYRKVREVF